MGPREEKETVQGHTADRLKTRSSSGTALWQTSVLTLARTQRVTPGVRSPLEESPGIRHPAVCPLGQTDWVTRGRSQEVRGEGRRGGRVAGGGGFRSPRTPSRSGSPQEVRPKKRGAERRGSARRAHAGHLPRPRLGLREHPAPSLHPLTPDPCHRAKIAHPSDSYTRRPGIPHRAPGLHSAAQPAAAAANISTAEPQQPPPPPHRCHSGSCASPRIRRPLSLSPASPAHSPTPQPIGHQRGRNEV